MAEPETDQPDTTACAVCERRLLPGERPHAFVTAAGAEVIVCELCKPRAEAAGWLRPDQAASRPAQLAGRRRQRGSLLAGLRARGERVGSRARPTRTGSPPRSRRDGGEGSAAGPDPAASGASGAPTPRAERAERARERPTTGSDPAVGGRNAAGPDVAEAIAAFNASEFPRTVAGLTRSLGAPQGTVIAVRTSSGANGARLTIAWDLAWYQWEIGPGKRRPEIRQIAKGETVDQLRAADRNWNVEVAADGSLRRRGGAGA